MHELEQLGVTHCRAMYGLSSAQDGKLELKLDNEMSSSFIETCSKHGLEYVSRHLLQKCGVFMLISMQADENGLLTLEFAAARALASIPASKLTENVKCLARALSTMAVDLDLEDAV